MRQEIMASRTKRTLFVSSHNNQGFYVPVVGMPRSHRHHTIQRAYFHTTPPRFLSLPESATALHHQYDDDDDDEQDLDELEQDIERFAASCLSQILPEDIFYKQDEEEVTLTSSALDQELGIDSMWGNEEHEEDDDDDDEFLVEEEHYLNPQQGLHQPATTTNKEANKDKKRLKQQSALEMLRNFDPQDPPASDNLEDLQLWLECAAQREAVLKYQKLVDSARDRKGFDSMSYMQRYIVRWYQSLRDAIDTRQKEYLSNNDHRRAKKRYGPLLCSLPPDKLAVVTSHEAITEALMGALRNGREGVPLVKMAHVIGSAVEVEVISQRRMRDLYRNDDSLKYDEGEDDGESESNSNESSSSREETETLDKRPTAMDKWTFSATHLKRFMEDLKRIDPKLDTSKRAVNYAVRRAKQAMNSEDQWTSEDIIHVGACLLSILLETAKIDDNGTEEPAFTLEKSWSHAEKKSTSFILLNDKLYKLFVEDDYQSLAAVTTRHTPMIIPPRDWVGPKDGGYRWLNVDFMRTHGSNLQKEALQHADLSNVFDGLNVLGRTAWKINKEILDIGQHCWANNVAIGDIPSRADVPVPLEPPRPDRIDPEFFADKESPELQAFLKENREYREALFKSRRMHQKNMDLRSLRGSAILKLDQAEKFKDFERIYFPYNLDFRGRACKLHEFAFLT
jgi:DNA-directed RNA polymerase